MRLLVYVPILIMFLKVTVLFKARPRGMLKIDNVAHVFQRLNTFWTKSGRYLLGGLGWSIFSSHSCQPVA